MKPIPAALLTLLFVYGCGNNYSPDSKQQAFAAELTHTFTLPLKIDSAFIVSLDTLEALDTKRLLEMKNDSIDTYLAGELKSSISGCLMIDRLKQSGRYQGYVDSLNIGMLKDAMAFKIGKITLPNKHFMLLWGINEGSYEADPGYSGVSIIASYPNSSGGFTHVIVGEQYNAGDPPAMMQRTTYAEISEKEIRVKTQTSNEDIDAGTIATETKKLTLLIKEKNLELVQAH